LFSRNPSGGGVASSFNMRGRRAEHQDKSQRSEASEPEHQHRAPTSLSSGEAQPTERASSSFLALEDSLCWNDDARERQQARIARQSKNTLRTGLSLRSPQARRGLDESFLAAAEPDASVKKLSDPELLQLYATTIRLCAENRVNAVNSWQLNLIDHIAAVAFRSEGSHDAQRGRAPRHSVQDDLTREALDTNFALAGSTIDAGVKIYAYRVDSVHNNAYRVLNGLAQHAADEDESPEETATDSATVAGDEEPAEATPSSRSRQRSKLVKCGWGEATLESNPEHLTLQSLEEGCSIDPLFMKLSELFDQSGSQELLVRVLDLLADGTMALDAEEHAEAVGDASHPDDQDETAADPYIEIAAELFPNAMLAWTQRGQKALCPNFQRLFHQLENDAAEAWRTAGTNIASGEVGLHGLVPGTSAKEGHLFPEEDMFGPPRDYGDGFEHMELFPSSVATAYEAVPALSGGADASDAISDTESASGAVAAAAAATHDDDDDHEDDHDDHAALRLAESHASSSGGGGSDDALHTSLFGSAAMAPGCADAFQLYLNLFRNGQAAGSLLRAIPRELFSSWAGPEHWRPPHAAGLLAGQPHPSSAKRPRPKAGQQQQQLDWRKPVSDPAFDNKFQVCRRRGVTQLSAAVLERHSEQRTTLPQDHQYTIDALMRLFTQPSCSIMVAAARPHASRDNARSGAGAGAGASASAPYTDTNLQALQTELDWRAFEDENFCAPLERSSSQLSTADAESSDTELETAFHALDLVSDVDALGCIDARHLVPLVDAPAAVERIDLAHATRAKRVDMHLLKNVLWEVIQRHLATHCAETEASCENPGIRPGNEARLRALLPEIWPRLGQDLRSEVSLSYIFIALLHLANERALILESCRPLLDDMRIASGTSSSASSFQTATGNGSSLSA